MKCVQVLVLVILCYLSKSDAVCRKILAKGISSTDRATIVNRHNAIRLDAANRRIPGQPKAANMKRISWDDSLAAAAQRIAETCVFAHVKVQDSRFSVGQNLYWSASTNYNTAANWLEGINAWYNEYKTYRFGTSRYDHYTQLVWANTYKVGCGYTSYLNQQGWYEKLYVCNYGPAGNYIGQDPYRVGAGCENLC